MLANKTKIIRIGNSQGVRIPRSLLEQAGMAKGEQGDVLGQPVELEVEDGGILIRVIRHARANWEEQLSQMAGSGDDSLLDELPQSSRWDEKEWVW